MTGGAWYASVAPGARRLFAGRHYSRVTLADGRIVVTTRRRRRRLDLPVASMQLVGTSNRLLFQVLARGEDDRIHVFEFRPRHRALGRALADACR